jgi:hypothetical protein
MNEVISEFELLGKKDNSSIKECGWLPLLLLSLRLSGMVLFFLGNRTAGF